MLTVAVIPFDRSLRSASSVSEKGKPPKYYYFQRRKVIVTLFEPTLSLNGPIPYQNEFFIWKNEIIFFFLARFENK